MALITEFATHSREQWLELRSHYIGGSDAGAVMGLDPYKSPYSLWCEKTGRTTPFEGNLQTEVGTYLEAMVAMLFSREKNRKVRRKNATLVNSDYPWACANVDRIVVGENSLLEIKTTTSLPVMRQVKNGEYPDRWYCQMTHYLAVTGCRKAYLAVLVNCRELHIYELERDQAEIDALMAAEKRFWESVTSDTPPAMDGSEATETALAEVFPDSNGESVELFGRDALVSEYESLKAAIKTTEQRLREIENIIKGDMGDAESAVGSTYKITWKTQERSTFQAKAFAADHPEMDLSGYWKTSKSRPFTIRFNNNKKEDT